MKKHKGTQSDFKDKHLIGEKSFFAHLVELKKDYKTKDETIKRVIEIFEQGDYRYSDLWDAIVVAGFIDNKAINMKKIGEKLPDNLNKEGLKEIKGPQKIFKLYAEKIAKKRGFTVKEYESPILGGKSDVLAFNENKRLLIECCSCRISKAIDYLSSQNTILWVMLRAFNLNKIIIFEFSRGKNWQNFSDYHNEYTMNQMTKQYNKIIKHF